MMETKIQSSKGKGGRGKEKGGRGKGKGKGERGKGKGERGKGKGEPWVLKFMLPTADLILTSHKGRCLLLLGQRRDDGN